MAAMGIAAFKVFMVTDTGRSYPHMTGIGVHDHGDLYRIFERVADTGLPLMVHPHDQGLMSAIEQAFWDRGERDYRAYARAYSAHDGIIWDTATAILLRIQRALGTKLHLLHTQTRGQVDLIRAAKGDGQDVSAEINTWALFLGNEWANIERLGSYALSYYVPEANTEPLWRALRDGTVDVFSTDHAPHTREEKEIGWTDMWKASGGLPHLQETLPLFLTEVAAGRISLERLVEVASSAPARLLGVYPRKGAIVPGADADLVVVDLAARGTIREADVLSKCGWTAWDGREVQGLPRMTFVRGRPVYRDGVVTGEPGWGRLVRRPD
jgi:dihydroorotase-like cyclic amidohydrolase